jgi:glycosyltransferase involved in cell wall biosynthesis
MNFKTSLSIVTPLYNRADLVLETLESVQRSSLGPDMENIYVEHLIYDDCSTDNSYEVVQEFSQKEDLAIPIKLIKGEQNRGQSFAKNILIEESKSEYIWVLDSDDIMFQRSFYNILNFARAKNKPDWILTEFISVDQDLKYLSDKDFYLWKYENIRDFLQSIFDGVFYLQANVLFKKEFYQKTRGFDGDRRIAEDLEFYLRCFFTEIMPEIFPSPLYLHRIHSGNSSRSVTRPSHQADLDEFKAIFKKELSRYDL